MENKDKMTLGVGDEPMPFFCEKISWGSLWQMI